MAERTWAMGFSALRPFVRGRITPARPAAAINRVMVIAPHPDDESIGCAGTLLLHKQAGANVTVLCATDGRTSRAHALDPEEMARRRRLEAQACAERLGIDRLEWVGLPAGAWRDEQLIAALGTAMKRYQPDLVYAPSRVDFHPEHLRVARALAQFWRGSPNHPARVRIYPVQVPLTPALANVVVDVTGVIAQARVAMDAYLTQLANIPRTFRQRRYAGCWSGAGVYAEEFWELSAESYVRLHPDLEVLDGFRGVREHAVSDPLAYFQGYVARGRLRATSS